MAEVGAVGIAAPTVVSGSLGISMAKGKNIQNNQRVTLGSYKKK